MSTQTKLSDHFTLAEAVHSDTAIAKNISNVPPIETILVMGKTAVCMERVRAALGNKSITINSWYRSPALNTALGSKSTSQHLRGEAVDFTCEGFGTPLDICNKLIELKSLIRFDQLILEHTWVHISFAIPPRINKGQVLSLLSSGGYAIGLTDKKGNPYDRPKSGS